MTASADSVEESVQMAKRNIERGVAIADATWDVSMKGSTRNMYMADQYDTSSGWTSGASDVWPLTAAIEAHCSLLEALNAVREYDEALYTAYYSQYESQLKTLIYNLDFYRGTYTRPSYATTDTRWRPYAVPRASVRGGANVTGILNVYDDQMWLCRELIRAYRLTNNEEYLTTATYLADYCIDGWDCWRDASGKEYGGITWGPGYNSKHACSNAPFIQPLVWLSDIYRNTNEEMTYYYRNTKNEPVNESRLRSELYLEFAIKIYAWQREHLYDRSGVYFDMMGADGTIIIKDGYRGHVDCGGAGGAFYPYNTGTMISGAAELYRVTSEVRFQEDLTKSASGANSKFSTYVRKLGTYDYKTDETAENGFLTWFNNVLMRSYADALDYATNLAPKTGLNAFQTNLDYAFENFARNNLLPIHLLTGWGDETKTKAFHQFTFVAQYGVLAQYHIRNAKSSGVEDVVVDKPIEDEMVYSLSGVCLGKLSEIRSQIPAGIYIVGGRKVAIK